MELPCSNVAQAYGIDLSMINLILITATVVAASIGTPAIPGGRVIILASALQNTGIPIDGLIVIIGIDRILGMFRTAVNVTGDLTACVIFNKFYGTVLSDKTIANNIENSSAKSPKPVNYVNSHPNCITNKHSNFCIFT
ncbi:MAG: Na+/H+-dicarboxylate symporter [Saprospiraceae bacterium]|jgi:Na+/H+-dicarboxylate symporter